ncbi:cytochrome P450 [Xylariaceae sp. FL1651]|nr:cytochrome P450 [Xylariaceae sp. FL1651]
MAQGPARDAIQSLMWLVGLPFLTWYAWKWYQERQIERAFALEKGCKPLKPWNSKWPLGLDFLFKALVVGKEGHILKFFTEVIDECGHTFVQHLLAVPGIDTVEPENIETVLSSNFNDYDLGLRPMTFRALLGSGIFTQDGAEWKHSRQLLRPQFASNKTQNFIEIQECVERLVSSVPTNGIVDLQPLFFKLTFETTMFLLFGEHAYNLKEVTEKESDFASAFNLAQDYLANRGRLGHLYWLFNDKKFHDACKTCHEFIDETVAKALDTSEGKNRRSRDEDGNYIFIDALVEQTRDRTVLRDQCLNVLLAGRDTTGCCLSWTFRLLARHQRVLERLRNEIKDVVSLGSDAVPPTRDELKRMPYLALVLKEVLRLYPSVPVNSRAAINPTTLPVGGGADGKSPVFVKKGQAVGYCVYAMHRRKDIYGEDAEEFRPERWEGDELKNIHNYAYLPFNGGPRICLGQEFALLEASYTVARMLQIFPKIEVPSTEAPVEIGHERQNLTLVVSCADGCVVSLGR